MKRYKIITSIILAVIMTLSIIPVYGVHTVAYAEEYSQEGKDAQSSVTITQNGNNWTLENDVMRTVISFSDGSIDMTSFYNKLVDREYLTGQGERHLFYHKYEGNDIYADDGGWTLESSAISDISLYNINWGKQLEIVISRDVPHKMAIKLIFEIYNGRAGLRYQTFIKNNEGVEKTINVSDIIALNFPNENKTIYYAHGTIAWSNTRDSLASGKYNCITRYDTGDGWILSPENNFATSLEPGGFVGDENHPFLYINAWSGIDNVKVSTDPLAVQLVLFPNEEVEYFSVNLEVFKGDEWDGRMAVSEHLRKRFRYHDTSRIFSLNDWESYLAGMRSESYYRDVLIPVAKEAGFDNIHVDDFWNGEGEIFNRDSDQCLTSFTHDLPALADYVNEQGMKFGLWFSPTGGFWGEERDLANPETIELKKAQLENTLIDKYNCEWTQIDLGILWKKDEITSYSHPSDSVYRKMLKLREYMNYFTHKYPDFLMQVTCEVDNPRGRQGVGLLHIPDNGMAGMYNRTEYGNSLLDMFGYFGIFPTEGMLDTWGSWSVDVNNWTDSMGWYYQFLLSRHVTVYFDPATWSLEGRSLFRKFSDWRKNPRIKSVLNEILRPVYNGPNNDNTGPYSWMFMNEDKSTGILIAVGGSNKTVDVVNLNLRWLDDNKTYLIEDITLNDDGEYKYSFKCKKTGAELKSPGFTVDLSESQSRGKAFWIQELSSENPQVLYADDKVYSYTESWNGNELRVDVTGMPNTTAKVIVYKDSVGYTEIKDVAIGPDGTGYQTFDNTSFTYPEVQLKTPAADGQTVNLTWFNYSSRELGLIIERKTGLDDNWQVIDTVPVDSNTYVDSGLEPAQLYSYRVKPIYGEGEGSYSNEASVWTKGFSSWGTIYQKDFEDGDLSDFSIASGNWNIHTEEDGNKVLRQSDWYNDAFIYAGDSSWRDYTFEARVKLNSGQNFGILGRNGYQMDYYANTVRLFDRKNFSPILSSPFALEAGKWYTFKGEFNGNRIKYYIDGELMCEYENFAYPSGRIGFMTWSADASFDDVVVSGEVVASVKFTPLQPGTKLNAVPLIEGTAKYADVLELYVDGVMTGTVTPRPDGSWSYKFSDENPLSDGKHILMCIAKGQEGQIVARDYAEITVDSANAVVPQIEIMTPHQSDIVDKNTVEIRGTVDRASYVTITVYNADENIVYESALEASENEEWSKILGLENGEYKAVITARDKEYIYSSSTKSVDFTVKSDIVLKTVISDDFEEGNIDNWSARGGSWSVVTDNDGNKILKQSVSGDAFIFCGEPEWGNYVLEARVRLDSGVNLGLVARWNGSNLNCYRADYYHNNARLYNASNDTGTMQRGSFTMESGKWYLFRLELHGNVIRFYVDGELKCTLEDSQFSSGLIGLQAWQTIASFDDVTVRLIIDKGALAARIAEARERNETDYTPESWAVLESALQDAEAVYKNDEASQEEVDNALASLEAAIAGLEIIPQGSKPFTIVSTGVIDRSTGIKAVVNIELTPGVGTHAGNEVVVFQLMKGDIPISIVAVEKDIASKESITAHFNVTDPQNSNYKVKVFVLDEYNSDLTAPISLAYPVVLD